MPGLSPELQTLLQQFMAARVLSHSEVEQARVGVEQQFSRSPGATVKACITAINAEIKPLGLEIRTVRPRSSDGSGGGEGEGSGSGSSAADAEEYYHGIVQTTDDHIAKLHGSDLEPWQLEVYKKCLEAMVDRCTCFLMC